MCYKILNGIVHVNRDSFFVMAETSRTCGHSMKPNSMSSFNATFFWIRIVNVWNALPDKVVSAPSVSIVSNTDCLVLICQIMFYIDAFIVSFVLYFMGPYKSRFSCL